MKIGFLTADWSNAFETEDGSYVPGGSAWYRCINPAVQLSNHGFDVVISQAAAISPNGLVLVDGQKVEHDDCDIVVMQRIMNNFGVRLIEAAQKAGQKVINDVDDWYWGLHPSNQAYLTTDPRYNPDVNSRHYRASVEASDLVTVSTPFLAERIAQWGCEVVVVRNAVDLHRWTPKEDREPPTVGWVGSTSHRSGDLETLQGIVGPFLEKHDLRWHDSGWVPGFPLSHKLAGVPSERATSTGIVPIFQYPEVFKKIDIGLVPLSSHDFNQGKSFLKGLEYAAAGVPFIAQATPEYLFLEEEYGIGVTAKKPRHWVAELERLRDPDERQDQILRNAKAIDQLDITERWVDWASVFMAVL